MWKKQNYRYVNGEKVLMGINIYHHPHAPAYVYNSQSPFHKKTPWVLHHPGDPNHLKHFVTKKASIVAFTRLPIKVTNLMSGKEVDDWDDTPYFCRVDSESYWSN